MAHTDVSMAPSQAPLLTPSTPGQDQPAGNADPPKIGLFLQCIYYYILIKVAAREKHFYVLWLHRCSTRWFQPRLKSEPSPPVPIKHLPLLLSVARRQEGHGKCLESRPSSSEGGHGPSPGSAELPSRHGPEGGGSQPRRHGSHSGAQGLRASACLGLCFLLKEELLARR